MAAFAQGIGAFMDRMEEYRAQGYTVFEGLYDETTMQAWRDEQDRLQTISTKGPMCENRPLGSAICSNERRN